MDQGAMDDPFLKIRTRSLLLWLLLGLPVVAVITAVLGLVPGIPTDAQATSTLVVMAIYLWVILWLARQARKHHVDVRAMLRPPPHMPLLRIIGLTGLIILFSFGAIWALFLPLSYLAPDLVAQVILRNQAVPLAESGASPLMTGIGVFTIAILAPFTEEAIFRGFLLNRWSARWGLAAGVLLSSATFAVLHLNVLGMFAVGLVLASLYLATRSLAVPMLVHGANNLAVLLIAALSAHAPQPAEPRTLDAFRAEARGPLIIFALALPVLLAYLRSQRHLLRAPRPYPPAPPAEAVAPDLPAPPDQG